MELHPAKYKNMVFHRFWCIAISWWKFLLKPLKPFTKTKSFLLLQHMLKAPITSLYRCHRETLVNRVRSASPTSCMQIHPGRVSLTGYKWNCPLLNHVNTPLLLRWLKCSSSLPESPNREPEWLFVCSCCLRYLQAIWVLLLPVYIYNFSIREPTLLCTGIKVSVWSRPAVF